MKIMQLNVIICVISIFLTVHPVWADSNQSQPHTLSDSVSTMDQAHIHFEKETIDLGELLQGEVATGFFEFTNKGEADLDIPVVKPSCGCTRNGDWDKRVKPGQKGKIEIAFDTKGREGLFRKLVKVKTNDPSRRSVELWIKGNIKKSLELTPTFFNFGRVEPGKKVKKKVRIKHILDQELVISGVHGDKSKFDFELKTVKSGIEYELVCETRVDRLTGTTNDALIVSIEKPRKMELRVPIRIYQQTIVKVWPRDIRFNSAILKHEVSKIINIRVVQPHKLNIIKVDSPDNAIKVKVNEKIPKQYYQLICTFAKGYKPSEKPVFIVYNTDNRKLSQGRIPVQLKAKTK